MAKASEVLSMTLIERFWAVVCVLVAREGERDGGEFESIVCLKHKHTFHRPVQHGLGVASGNLHT